MPDELVLDFTSRVPKRRGRGGARNVAKFWHARYGAFLKDGFTDKEAMWGADNGLSLKSTQVKQLRRHRRKLVEWYMDRYGYSRMKAIEMAAKDLENKLEVEGIREKNLFYEVSP